MIINKILPFILGLIVNQNIIWVIKGNTTYVYIDVIVALVICIIQLFNGKRKYVVTKNIKYIRFYYYITIFASLVGLYIFAGTKYSLSPIYGVILFILSFFIFFATLSLTLQIRYMLKGFYVGFILNLLYSVLCYFLFYFHIDWRIIQYFSTGDDSPFAQYNDLYYRAQGLFMECSYYISYLSVGLPIILFMTKKNFTKIIFIVVCILLSAISFSGNLIFLIFSLLLYLFIVEKQLFTIKTLLKLIIPIAILTLLFISQISSALSEINFFELFVDSIQDLDISNEDNISNVTRLYGIMNALSLIISNPLGTGAGCSAPLLDLNFTSQYGAISTYSFPIRVILESGWLGFIFYFIAIVSIIIKLFKSENMWNKTLGISLLSCVLVQTANGIGWFGFILFLLGICVISVNKQITYKEIC